MYVCMFVNNFLAPIQVQLSPNFVTYTLGHRGQGDYISEGQGQRSRSVGEVCALLYVLLVLLCSLSWCIFIVSELVSCCCKQDYYVTIIITTTTTTIIINNLSDVHQGYSAAICYVVLPPESLPHWASLQVLAWTTICNCWNVSGDKIC